jgi:hypothetical protein
LALGLGIGLLGNLGLGPLVALGLGALGALGLYVFLCTLGLGRSFYSWYSRSCTLGTLGLVTLGTLGLGTLGTLGVRI